MFGHELRIDLMSNRRTPYMFLVPGLGLLVLFVLYPMGQIFWYSVHRYSFFSAHEYVGWANYVRLWNDPAFWLTLMNSMVCVLVTPILMMLSLLLALSVRRMAPRAAILRLLFFLPVITPIIVVGITWRWIFTEESGLLNYLISLFGAPKVAWLTHYPTNIISVMILTIWRGFGYYTMIFLAGLALIPVEVEEASLLDGASDVQRVRYILLPNLAPTLLFVFIVSSTSAIRIFTEVYTLIPGAPMSNKTLVAYLYRQAFERFDFGYASTIAVVLFVLTLAFSYVNVRLMERSA